MIPVNFTREPIIETIITPRDGYRLLIRGSKQGADEEFNVESVQVVTFGRAHFYRSLEKPRPFLLPVEDYQVIEVKESRAALKSNGFEKSIKIGGGKEGLSRKPSLESEELLLPTGLEEEVQDDVTKEVVQQPNKRQDRHRSRRRRASEEREEMKKRVEEKAPFEKFKSSGETLKETKEVTSLSSFTHLFPPPTTLISETLHRYKDLQVPDVKPMESSNPMMNPPSEIEPTREGEENSLNRTSLISESHFSERCMNLTSWNYFLS